MKIEVENKVTRYTPYKSVFGRLCFLPSSGLVDNENRLLTYENCSINFASYLYNTQKVAYENIVKAIWKSKYYYDETANPERLLAGDYVWIVRGGKLWKFVDEYKNPYAVVDIERIIKKE